MYGILIFLCLLPLWYFSSLPRNYRLARATGLPIVVSPINPANPFWLVFSSMFEPTLFRCLPQLVYDRIKVTIFGWEYRCRHAVNDKVGPVFVLVTPSSNEVWIADPDMAASVLLRRNDFLQLEFASRIMAIFGPNMTSSDGDDWQRFRKIVAPVVNERIMKDVWEESSRQAQRMINTLSEGTTVSMQGHIRSTRKPPEATEETIDGLRLIAINVIGFVGYNARHAWSRDQKTGSPPKGYQLTFIDAMLAVVNNFVLAVVLPNRMLHSKLMPAVIKTLGEAKIEFPRYAKSFIAQERVTQNGHFTLMSALVKKMVAPGPGSEKISDYNHKVTSSFDRSLSTASSLSEDEVIGNLFNFTIAGFDTTASTMAYAIMALALEPQWQDWIIEEIDAVSQIESKTDYETTFPRMTRCLALMYETLRLHTPVLHVTRNTKTNQTLGDVVIPANTNVFIAAGCIHVSPTLYKPDPLIFRPTRWLCSPSTGERQAGLDSLRSPPKGTFLAWSSGPRYCPGSKMSQVEFTSVVRTIFASWKVEALGPKGETGTKAREWLKGVMRESQPKITLQVRKPSDVKLRWIKR